MGTKTVKYNKQGINQLPNDKPVLYRIKTESGNLNYVGIAQRGWVRERISGHLKEIPGAKVQIEQFSSIEEAGKKEINVIRRTLAKHHKEGK
ncbi:MAG: hypothetical protein WCB64_03255 [Desulfobaccales bacterium]